MPGSTFSSASSFRRVRLVRGAAATSRARGTNAAASPFACSTRRVRSDSASGERPGDLAAGLPESTLSLHERLVPGGRPVLGGRRDVAEGAVDVVGGVDEEEPQVDRREAGLLQRRRTPEALEDLPFHRAPLGGVDRVDRRPPHLLDEEGPGQVAEHRLRAVDAERKSAGSATR